MLAEIYRGKRFKMYVPVANQVILYQMYPTSCEMSQMYPNDQQTH